MFQENGRRGRKKERLCSHLQPSQGRTSRENSACANRASSVFHTVQTFCSRGFSTPQRAASLKSNSLLELASYYRFLLRDGGREKCSYFSAGRHHPEGRAEEGREGMGGRREERREEQKKGETAAERHIRKYELSRVELDLLPFHCQRT